MLHEGLEDVLILSPGEKQSLQCATVFEKNVFWQGFFW